MANSAKNRAKSGSTGRGATERRRVTDRILHNNAHLTELLLDSLPYPAMLIQKDRTVLAANHIARQLGAKVGEYCWQDFGQSEFIPDKDKQYIDKHKEAPPGGTHCTYCKADEALQKQTHINNPEIKAWDKVWDTHWIPLDKETYLNYAIDVTHIVREDEKLRMSEIKHRTLAQNIPGLVYRTLAKQDNRMLFFNNMLKLMTGYKESELKAGEICSIEPHILSEDRDKVRDTVKHACDEKEPFQVEYRFECKNGDIKWFKEIGRPTFGPDDELLFIDGIITDITDRKQVENWVGGLNRLKEDLLKPGDLHAKLKCITDGVVEIFDADFARIWIIKHGDRCDSGCVHASVNGGAHVCRHREGCLHLMSSSGRYTHTDGKGHQRVPFGCYKIGRVAAADKSKFFTNDVTNDPEVHDHAWAKKLGLVSFAGYRLLSETGQPMGVMALFSKHTLSPSEDMLLENLANTAAQVIQTAGSEEALKESEEKFRNLAEHSPNMIFINQKGRVVYANDKCEELMGYTKEEFCAPDFDFRSLIAPEFRDLVEVNFDAHIRGEDVEPYEYGLVNKKGERIHTILTTQLIKYEGQDAILGTVTDITERKRAQQKLKESEEHYQQLFESMHEAFALCKIILDKEGKAVDYRFLKINPAFAEQSGMDIKTTVGKTIKEVFPDIEARWIQRYCNVAITQKPIHFIDYNHNTNKYYDVFAFPITKEKFSMLFRDITDEHLAEEKLRDESAFREAVIERAAEGICVCHAVEEHPYVEFTVWNERMQEITGYTMDEINRLGWYQTVYPDSEVRERIIERMERMRQGDDLVAEEWEITRKDGLKRLLAISTSVITTEGDKSHVLALMHDITEEKKAQAERENLLKSRIAKSQ
jgi:PAS domain S-box-containing protein